MNQITESGYYEIGYVRPYYGCIGLWGIKRNDVWIKANVVDVRTGKLIKAVTLQNAKSAVKGG